MEPSFGAGMERYFLAAYLANGQWCQQIQASTAL